MPKSSIVSNKGDNTRLWTWAALLLPAVLKLCFLHADRVFEAHTMAMEWLASGHFRYHYFGSWDHAFQFPVYTAVLAFLYKLGSGTTGALVFQVGCGSAVAYLSMCLTKLVLVGKPYAHRLGLVVAVLVGLSPFLAFYQVRMVHPFAWDMLLAMAVLFLALRASPTNDRSMLLLFAVGGLGVLNRPTLGVLMLPFALQHGRSLFGLERLGLKVSLMVLLLAPIGAWLLRNHSVTGRYQLTSVTDQMIWMGVQEETEGSGHLANGDSYFHLLSIPERHLLFEVDANDRSTFFREKWKSEAVAQPGLRWKMFWVKLKNFWTFRGHFGQDHALVNQWAIMVFKGIALVELLLVGLALIQGDRKLNAIIVSVVLLSILQCAFYFETRHRLLVEPMIVVVVLAALARSIERIRGGLKEGKEPVTALRSTKFGPPTGTT